LKLLCDEGVDRPIVDALRGAGHDVSYVAEMAPGISDDEVLAVAAKDRAVVLTIDKDFGELVYRQGRAHHGVLLLRLHGFDSTEKSNIVLRAVAEHGDELPGAFAVIDRNRIRVRRSSS
jgi:predicted nuclease of predicted toxin-antitoxin system